MLTNECLFGFLFAVFFGCCIAGAGFTFLLPEVRGRDPDVIYELLKRAEGKAIIYGPELSEMLSACPVHAYRAVDLRDVHLDDPTLPPLPAPASGDEIAMIFHTSGSTSGRPKLVPCSYSWWEMCLYKSAQCTTPRNPKRQDVTVWM